MSNVELTCPKCGEKIQFDSDKKQETDKVFCSYCGNEMTAMEAVQIALDESQKMLDEMQAKRVSINNVDRDELENLYTLARKAKNADDIVPASKLYGEILEKDPNNWEPNFYAVYFTARNSSIANMEMEASNIKESMLLVTALLAQKFESEGVSQELVSIITELTEKLTLLTQCYKKNSMEFLELCEMSEDAAEYIDEHRGICAECALIMYAWAICLEGHWGDKLGTFIAQSYATGIEHHKRLAELMLTEADFIHQKSEILKHAESVKKYNPNYNVGTINRKSRSNVNSNSRPSNSYSGTSNTIRPQANNDSDGGCYIATAVYGSYDCPEVWTLRRFRDCTLYESWYGRTFIKVYYAISPTLVKWFGKTQWFKKSWSAVLNRFVAKLNNEGVANSPYNDRKF